MVSNREPYIHERGADGIVVKRPGQRPGDGGRAGDARLLGHLDRARQRQRRPRGGRRHDRVARAARAATSTGCAASGSAPRRSRATTTASPTKACGRCATSPTCGRCSASPTGKHYRVVNQRFADAVVAEARGEDPVVLVQDYHFALLPAMIREQLPRATILTFWHIPWPNPESFGICPWRREILRGHARQHDPGLPHPLPLQELHRDGRPLPRGAHRARAFDHLLPGRGDAGRELPDLDRMAARTRRAAWPPVGRVPAARVRAAGLLPDDLPGGRRRPLRLHQGHPRAAERGRAPAREAAGVDRPLRLRPGGGADAQRARRVPQLPGAHRSASPSASTSASAGPATSRCTCWPSTTSTTR